MTISDQNDEWIAKQLSRAAERVREPLASTTANPDRTAATVAHSGLAAHPVVAAILAVTPTVDPVYGKTVTDFDGNLYDAEPIAAKQAAAVLRWLAAERFDCADYTDTNTAEILRALADEVEAAGTERTER